MSGSARLPPSVLICLTQSGVNQERIGNQVRMWGVVNEFAPTGADGNQPRASSSHERRPGLTATPKPLALKGQRLIDTFPVPLSGHQLLAPPHPGRRLLRELALGWFPWPLSGHHSRCRRQAPEKPLSLPGRSTSRAGQGRAGQEHCPPVVAFREFGLVMKSFPALNLSEAPKRNRGRI